VGVLMLLYPAHKFVHLQVPGALVPGTLVLDWYSGSALPNGIASGSTHVDSNFLGTFFSYETCRPKFLHEFFRQVGALLNGSYNTVADEDPQVQ
jgi:hypothetical protein